jgi:hypothetical protein
MENKPNQPTSGANSSQSTGTSKSASSANPTDRSRSASAAASASNAQNSPDMTAVSSTDTSSAASSDTSGSTTQQTTSAQSADQAAQPTVGAGKESQPQSWMNVSSWLDGTNQLPQSVKDSVKDLSTKATDQFNKLTSTQKVIGGALLVSGLSWLALRSKSKSSADTKSGRKYGSNTDYRSGSRTYGSYGSYSAGSSADQQFQGPYGNSPSRGISDDYPTKSSTDYRNSGAGTSGFGDEDYSTDL